MRQQQFFKTGACCLFIAGLLAGSLLAAITPEQKKELKEIEAEVAKVAPLITKKKYEDASAAIQKVEERFETFVKDADLKETDPILKKVTVQLEKAKEKLAKASGKGTVSFEKNVAPIIASKCTGCHSDDPKGGLALDTFEGLEKGGRSGNLVIPGDPESSLLVRRLIDPDDQQRMPKGKDALTEKEIKAIAAWISEGAKFEGDKTAAMSALSKAAAAGKPVAPPKKLEIQKETGKETVHFMKDLMPELVDTCGRCHNDRVKRKGFSVMSFEKLMKGGDSGSVITAGNLDDSRFWRLLNGPDDGSPVMPAGNQTGITRKWYDNVKTWILEGAKFDGGDPKKDFPSIEEREATARASYSPEKWLEIRKKSSDGEWKKTFPNAEAKQRESSELLLYGDVPEERLEQIEKWAMEHVAFLRQTFKIKDDPVWKGKLGVFVFKERFGYEEFNNSVHKRDVPREVFGHSQVNSTFTDAFIALQDIGDSPTESSPGMQVNLIDQVTGAFLKRGGGGLPDWLIRGAGLALAHQKSAGNPFLAAMPRTAGGILQESRLTEPGLIFVDGTFSPGEVGPIGFTLVEFLMKRGGIPQFGLFVQKLQSGAKPEVAIKDVYQTDGKTLAIQYAGSLPSGGGPKKGKKP